MGRGLRSGCDDETRRLGICDGFFQDTGATSLEPLATIYAMPRRPDECSAPVYGADVNHKRGRPRGIAPLGWCNIDKREIGYQGDPTDRADIRRRRQGRECCGRLGNSGATRTPPRIANDQPAAPVGRPSVRHPETAIGSLAAVKGARGQSGREWPSMHARRRFVSTKRGKTQAGMRRHSTPPLDGRAQSFRLASMASPRPLKETGRMIGLREPFSKVRSPCPELAFRAAIFSCVSSTLATQYWPQRL